jgi:hypothetical protein
MTSELKEAGDFVRMVTESRRMELDDVRRMEERRNIHKDNSLEK